ncbi:type VI secretion system baseplate subunit TssK [uncultured Shewanella sp.]|uniref:type VI secretion system baseplate subunit TssK n=1 Tax=uncultured Shewanella sp. TaxID=173975 RepID=UPI002611AFA9|nr:type VI secretion system baseplate subunit TssK [uncultured Shewanella sp.]
MTHQVPAPVKWEIGQPLLPEHLIAQEESLLAEASERVSTLGFPSYGISSIKWDEALLAEEGCLSIIRLRLLTKANSVFIDFPGNSTVLTAPVELKDHRDPNVYYYVLKENGPSQHHSVTPLIPKNDNISRRLFKLILSANQVLPADFEYLLTDHDVIEQGCLGQFEKPYNSDWQLASSFVPPLIQLGRSPYLAPSLKQLLIVMRRFRADLRQEYSAKNLPISLLYGVKQCLHSVQENIRLMENLNISERTHGELKLHPYYLYESLQSLLTDITLYRGEWPEREPSPYRHQELHSLFNHLINQLVLRMKINKSESQCFELLLTDGVYSSPLPPGIKQDDKLYLVVDCHNQAPLDHDDLPTLSSRARVPVLNDYALHGGELLPVDNPTFGYEFGDNIQCFELVPSAERKHIQQDNDVGFYAQSAYRHMSFYLYRKLPFEISEKVESF